MKKSFISIPILLALVLQAQTNTPAPGTAADAASVAGAATNSAASTNKPPRLPTEIFADSANFDLKSRIAVYIGHVRILDSQMKLNCGVMTAHVPESGRIDDIVAEQDVVIDALDNEGKPLHATADRAVYRYRVTGAGTNDTIELTGNPYPKVEKEGGTVTGKTIVWDRANNSFGGTDVHMVVQPQAIEQHNAPAASPDQK